MALEKPANEPTKPNMPQGKAVPDNYILPTKQNQVSIYDSFTDPTPFFARLENVRDM